MTNALVKTQLSYCGPIVDCLLFLCGFSLIFRQLMVSHLILKTPSEQAAPALMRILRSYTASTTMLPSPLHDASVLKQRLLIHQRVQRIGQGELIPVINLFYLEERSNNYISQSILLFKAW